MELKPGDRLRVWSKLVSGGLELWGICTVAPNRYDETDREDGDWVHLLFDSGQKWRGDKDRLFKNFQIDKLHSITPQEVSQRIQALGAIARSLLEAGDLTCRSQTTPRYEEELIQVAASAIAALVDARMQRQDLENQKKGFVNNLSPDIKLLIAESLVISDVRAERSRQDIKFNQVMPIRQDPLVWLLVLAEEMAEVAEEILLDQNPPTEE